MVEIVFDEIGIKKVVEGGDIVADIVEPTIGPRGKNILISKGYGSPYSTNDGITGARQANSKDSFIQMGIAMAQEVAENTNDAAGDATSTSITLYRAFLREGVKSMLLGGADGLMVAKGMKQAVSDITEELSEFSRPIDTIEQAEQIAITSVEDVNIGKIIAQTVTKVGKDGLVTVQESPTSFGVEAEIVEGMEIEKGYVAQYMVNNYEKMIAEYLDVPVMVSDANLSSPQDIIDFIAVARSHGMSNAVIIAPDFSQVCIDLAIGNKYRGIFELVLIKAPGFGDNQKEIIKDIAVMVGTKIFSPSLGQSLKTTGTFDEVVGKVDQIISTKDKTTIVRKNLTNKEEVAERIALLKARSETIESPHELERLVSRIARMAGGVGVIRVGAPNEDELKYLKDKIEDAVNATQSSIAEGVVAGGGVALLKAAKKCSPDKNAHPDFITGYQIVLKGIEAPIRRIVKNARQDDGVVVDKVYNGDSNYGYDAKNNVYGDMFELGIIDSVKSVRTSLLYSSAKVATFLPTGVFIGHREDTKVAE